MSWLRAVLSAALLVSAASASRAAVCTFDPLPSIDWSGVTDASNLDCVTSGGGDDFVVPSGTTVHAIAPILFTTTTPGNGGGRITVQSGGRFTCLLIDGCTEMALDRGLLCPNGSSCRIQGRYPELGVPAPGLVDSADTQSVFPAGDVVPCPGWDADDGPGGTGRFEPDCDGNLTAPGDVPGSRNEMGLVYLPSQWSSFFPTETLDNLQAGDVLLWTDPDLATSAGTPVDEGFAYEIVLVDSDFAASGVGLIVLDVRQTDPAAPRTDAAYPDVLRKVETSTLDAAILGSAGGSRGRILDTQTDVLPGTTQWLTSPVTGWNREERVGMYVRFECGAAGVACDEVFRISRTWNDVPDGLAPRDCTDGDQGCDLVEVYSPFGLPWDLPVGTRFWIDYGWRRGDSFSVYRPVRVHSAGGVQAVPANGDAPLFLGTPPPAAPHDLRAVVYEDGALRYSVAADGTGSVMEDFWFRDPYHGDTAALVSAVQTQNWTWRRVHRSGGSIAGAGVDHGFTWGQTGSLNGWVLEELGWRHGGDDWISAGGLVGGDPSDMVGRRIRFQYASNGSSSQQYASANAREFHLKIEDGECVQCATPTTAVVATPEAEYRSLLWIHPAAGGGACARIDELLSIGTGLSAAPGCELSSFVFAQTDVYRNTGGLRGLFDAETPLDARDGLIRDFGYLRGVFENHFVDDASLRNLLVLDYQLTLENTNKEDHQHAFPADCTATTCYQLQFNSGNPTPATSIELDRITVAFRDDSTVGTDWAYRLNQTDVPNIHTLDGLLAYMPPGAPTAGRGEMSVFHGNDSEVLAAFANTSRGPCIGTGYTSITSNGNENLLPGTTLLGVPLGLADPGAERYGPAPGSAADVAGCGALGGALAPGLFRWRAMSYWMGGIPPENGSRSFLPAPAAEAEAPIPDAPGIVTVPALGGAGAVGGVDVQFFSPGAGKLEVTHYTPSASDDLLALLGPPSLRPPLASEPIRVWDFRFETSMPTRVTFGYEPDELVGAIHEPHLTLYGLRSDGVWVELASQLDPNAQTISSLASGFTRFALGVRSTNVPTLSPAAAAVLALGLIGGALWARTRDRG